MTQHFLADVDFATVPVVGTRSAHDNSTYAASTAYVDTAVSGVSGGGTIVDTTIDFGATPVDGASFVITDAGVSSASMIKAAIKITTTATNTLDDHRHASAALQFGVEPASGSFTLDVISLFDLVSGQISIRYSY